MRARFVFALLLAAPLAAAPRTDFPTPRPLSSAEEAAVAALSRYLAGGAKALLADLSQSSPLRSLTHEEAFAEIETRLGPPASATWRLDTAMPSFAEHAAVFSVSFPSAIDDSVTFEMEREGNVWRVSNIRSTAEPVMRPVYLTKSAGPAKPVRDDRSDLFTDRRVALALTLPALAICVAGIAWRRRSRIAGNIIVIVAAVPVIAGTAMIAMPSPAKDRTPVSAPTPLKTTPQQPAGLLRLGQLLPLRRALANGESAPLHADTLPVGPVRDAAEVWTAQTLMQQDHADDARRILGRIPRSTNIPLAEILRARIAWDQKNSIDAVESYERAIDLGPGRDSLWLEAAEALSIVGFDERSDRYVDRIAEVGSRDPLVFYELSITSVMRGDEARAMRLLMAAWRMRPVERGRLYRIAPLWHVLKEGEMQKLLQPYLAAEPAFASAPPLRPMTVDGIESSVSGDFLQVKAGRAELDVPGGAVIAPANAKVIDAGTWRRELEQLALADFDDLRHDVRSSAALVQPVLRSRCSRTIAALAARNRWADIVVLTDPFAPSDERVPLELTILRAEAFSRLGKSEELRRLIADLIRNPVLKRKKDPEQFAEIAELFAEAEEYEPAIRLLERAQRDLDVPGIAQRIEQLTLEKELASSYSLFSTEHFDIRYPKNMPKERAQKMGSILEAERRRLLAAWFGSGLRKRIGVDLLSWEDFEHYTGSEYVAGLFTNKIFLPLANVDEFPPEIVVLMTHELAHALLAEATNNLAPRWFHEAFASRVEMKEASTNAFQLYKDERFLTVSLLDAVAGGSPDPELVYETYRIGETTLRFIEAKYGKAAIGRMIGAFRGGAATEEAVRAGIGGSVSDLDRLARAWGASQPAQFAESVVLYDKVRKPGHLSATEDDQ